jgi:hypothetical protein
MLGGNQENQVNVKEINLDSLEVVSIRRISNIKDLSKEELEKIQNTQHYLSKDKEINLR